MTEKVPNSRSKMRIKGSKTVGIEPYLIDCMAMNYSEKDSLDYLDSKGYTISAREYYRLKQEIKESTHERLNLIASEEFLSQHLDRIDTLRMIHNELIENYKKETNPTKKSNILMQLAEIQQYLSSYYDSTRYVMEQASKSQFRKQQQQKEQH